MKEVLWEVGSRLKMSNVLVAHLMYVLKNVNSNDTEREKTNYKTCCSESQVIVWNKMSDVWGYSKVAHTGCQECWQLKSCISTCKLPVVISTCTNQIPSRLFVDMWPRIRPVLIISFQKWNDKVCSGRTHLTSRGKVSKDSLSHQSYNVCILGQWRSSDDWLLVPKEGRMSQVYTCITLD